MFGLTILTLWLFSVADTLLFHTYFWQLKEYRLDRIIAHLGLKTGREMIFSFSSLVKGTLIFLLFLAPSEVKVWLLFLVGGVFLAEAFIFLKKALARELYHPKLTFRATEIIFGAVLLVILTAFWLYQKDVSPWIFVFGLLCLERAIVALVPLQILWTRLPVFIGQEKKLRQAREKIKQLGALKVIGVTGSYGKTSTKDFIAQILAKKYQVAKTQGTNNTKIGVAQNILQELGPETEIFVVEMGAYKKGEIADICRLIRPDIAVVTGVNEQHLALFGSLENLVEAKYEIIEALPGEGTAVFNSANHYCLKMAKKTARSFKTLLYQQGKPEKGLDFASDLVWADLIKEKNGGFSFRIHDQEGQLALETNLPGRHNIDNILAAVAVAKRLGLKNTQIAEGVRSLIPSSRALRATKGVDKTIFLDDTFSSNPHGFLVAIDCLRRIKAKRKMIITSGIIELGSAGAHLHQKLGRAMRGIVDLVILTNANFLDEIKKGLGREETKVIVENRPGEILKLVKKEGSHLVVLLEGRLPAKLIEALRIK